MSRPTYTPGPGGYAVAVIASLFAFLALLALGLTVSGQDATALIWVPYFGAMYGSIPVVVFGVPGAFAVHYACRYEPRQWVHVVAAGAAGLVAGLVMWAVVVPAPGYGVWVPVLGIATAIGRAVVIPLVRPTAERPRDHQVGLSL